LNQAEGSNEKHEEREVLPGGIVINRVKERSWARIGEIAFATTRYKVIITEKYKGVFGSDSSQTQTKT